MSLPTRNRPPGWLSDTLRQQVATIPPADPVWQNLSPQGGDPMADDETTTPAEHEAEADTAAAEPIVEQTHDDEQQPTAFPAVEIVKVPLSAEPKHHTAKCLRWFRVPINGTPTEFHADQEVSDPAALAAFEQYRAPVEFDG